VLGGQLLPILATMLYLAVLVVVASVSYLLIEQPGQEWARQAGWTKEHPDTVSSYLT
jgi:peptidoglycan/LPS O-acetylase OafA/YrhL